MKFASVVVGIAAMALLTACGPTDPQSSGPDDPGSVGTQSQAPNGEQTETTEESTDEKTEEGSGGSRDVFVKFVKNYCMDADELIDYYDQGADPSASGTLIYFSSCQSTEVDTASVQVLVASEGMSYKDLDWYKRYKQVEEEPERFPGEVHSYPVYIFESSEYTGLFLLSQATAPDVSNGMAFAKQLESDGWEIVHEFGPVY